MSGTSEMCCGSLRTIGTEERTDLDSELFGGKHRTGETGAFYL